MNRSLITLGTAVAALALAASAPLSASTGAAEGAAAKRVPIWGKAPCQHGASIFLRAFYAAESDPPNQVRLIVRRLEPGARAEVALGIHQGDSGSVAITHARADDAGTASLELAGARGFFSALAHVTAPGESCRLEIAGLVTPLP